MEKAPCWTDDEDYLVLYYRSLKKSNKFIVSKIYKYFRIKRTVAALSFRLSNALKDKKLSDYDDNKINLLKKNYKPLSENKITYKNENSFIKDLTRRKLIYEILDNVDNDLKVLSLPADNFKFEEELKNKFNRLNPESNSNFLCVEKLEEVYNNGISKAMNNNFQYIKGELKNVLPKINSTFNVIWLDFCSPYCKDIIDCLRIIESNNLLDDNGILAITLMFGRENDIDELQSYLSPHVINNPENLRFNAFPNYIGNQIFNNELNAFWINKYYNNSVDRKTAPMSLYLFKKTRISPKQIEIIESTSKVIV